MERHTHCAVSGWFIRGQTRQLASLSYRRVNTGTGPGTALRDGCIAALATRCECPA